MKQTISKKTREQAALICDVAASGGVIDLWSESPRWTRVYSDIRAGLNVSFEAISLAMAAYFYVGKTLPWTRAADAEAAQLIREGWTPS